jgi:hypothetical protein
VRSNLDFDIDLNVNLNATLDLDIDALDPQISAPPSGRTLI